MTARSWIGRLFARTASRPTKAPARRRPRLEVLEDRLAPASFTVVNTADSGFGSLRAAVDAANIFGGNNTINFAPAVAGQTITLAANDTNHPFAFGPTALVIVPGDDLTIVGDPSQAGVTLSGNNSHRLFGVYPGASLTLQNLTVSGGNATGGNGGNLTSGFGGGGGGGAGLGGAVFNAGTLNLLATTLTGNTARGGNGGTVAIVDGAGAFNGAGGGSAAFSGGNFNEPATAGGGGGGIGGPAGASSGGVGGANEFGTQTPVGTAGTAGGGGGGGNSRAGASGTALSSAGFGGGGGGGSFSAGGAGGFGAGGGGAGGNDKEGSGLGGAGGFGGGGGGGGAVASGAGGFGGGDGADNYGDGCAGGGGGAGLGGAVFNNGGTVNIVNSTLAGNTASGGPGGASVDFGLVLPAGGAGQGLGGAVFSRNGSVVVVNSTLSGNTADQGGRQVYLLGDAAAAQGTLNNSILGQNDSGALDFAAASINGGTAQTGGSHNLLGPQSGFAGGFLNIFLYPSDPSFETPAVGSYAYNPTGSPWAFTGSAGLAGNGSAFNNPAAPLGSQVAFLQRGGSSISQTVDFAAGTYALGFQAAQRPGNAQTFQVQVDGTVVATVTPTGSGAFAPYVTSNFTVTAGPHTIQFVGLNPKGGDNTAFLDQVTIYPISFSLLGPLQNNGGPTQTMAPLPGSPAIDAGASTLAVDAQGNPLTTDQRGLARVSGAAVDIGAFEIQAPALTALGASASSLVEGGSISLGGSFTDDPAYDQASTVVVSWGDGSADTTVNLGAGVLSFSGVTHQYTEESAGQPNGTYTISVVVTDPNTGSGTATTSVAVSDAPLSDQTTATALSAQEGASTGDQVVGSFSDADPNAVPSDYTATIYWGDGGSSPASAITQSGGTFSVHGAHTYAEDGAYHPYAVVTDNDGNPAQTGGSTVITSQTLVTETVAPVAPTAGVSGPGNGVPGQPRTFTFTASDPSPTDRAAGFVYTITWGDGSAPQTVARAAGNGSGALVDHVYTAPGTYTVTVSATDDDGATGAAATGSLTVQAVQMQGETLAVGGTLGNDNIILSPADATGAINVKFNGTSLGNFKPTDHILVYGQSGTDTIQLKSTAIRKTTYYVAVPAFLYGGGTGSDTLDARGSTANNVLTGGGGKNTLYGGQGRDLLIAGLGASQLNAGSGDDLLIGGWTAYDLTSSGMTYDRKLAALEAVMAEWGSADSYTTRLNDLQGGGGLNGSFLLNTSTVHDNGKVDTLIGTTGSALDWFLAGLTDVPKNKKSGEAQTPIR
jgi:hypothetical protein